MYPAIGEDDLECIKLAILASVEQYLNFPEGGGKSLGGIVEQFLVVLLDEDDSRCLVLEFVQLGPVDLPLHLVLIDLLLTCL